MAIQQITLKDCLDRTEPPEKVLALAVVDDTVFVSINEWKNDHDTSTQKTTADIAVSSASLREALELLAADRVREDLRPLDPPGNEQGQRAARLDGPRAGVVKL